MINIGAGFDTLYFRLRDYCKLNNSTGDHNTENFQIKKLIDLDVGSVIRRKIGMLKRSQIYSENEDSQIYQLLSINLSDSSNVGKLLENQLEANVPCLIISECVFMYLDVNSLNDLFKQLRTSLKINKSIKDYLLINYDAVDLDDMFSKNMTENLKINQEIDIYLNDKNSYLEINKKLIHVLGDSKSDETLESKNQILTMLEVFNRLDELQLQDLPIKRSKMETTEKQRIGRILPLDDQEIFRQIMEHYCLFLVSSFDFQLN